MATVLAFGCLYYLTTWFEWTKIWLVLQSARLFIFVPAAVGATLLFWLLRTARWAVLLGGGIGRVSFGELYLCTAVAVGLANFTPLQIGEAAKIEILRRAGTDARFGVIVFVIEKSFDLILLTLLAIVGAWTLFGASFAEFQIGAAIFAIILSAAVAAFYLSRRRELTEIHWPNRKNLLVAFCLTIAAWFALIAGWKLMFASISVELTFAQTIAVISLTSIAGIVSLIPGAFGVTEIGTAALLLRIGYNKPLAQTGGVLIGLHSLIILILALIHWLILLAAKSRAKSV